MNPSQASTLAPRFDALDPEVLADPYPTYARLRAAAPVCRGVGGTLVVPRHAEVAWLLREPRLGSEFPRKYHAASSGEGPASEFMHSIVLYRDPPAHTRLRALIGQAFAGRLVRSLERRVGDLVDELLEAPLERGRLDVVNDLAFPLPVMVACELMGLPASDRDAIRPHALALGRAFAAFVPEGARTEADAAVGRLRCYLGERLAERAREPGEDLLSRMLTAESGDERLTHEEIVDNAIFSFFAGFETTTNLIGNGVAALLEHPAELARLYADPGLVKSAVEEFLRWDAPIQGVARIVREPFEVGGKPLREGRVLVLLIGSANRDESTFERADELDVGRAGNRHLSFGGGIHYCLGATLARIEARAAFRELIGRTRGIAWDGEPRRELQTSFRAYATLPVALDTA